MKARAPAQLPEPGTDVGGYVLKARLGAGGFGTVYLAERGGQRYALKLVSLEELAPWGERELLMLARVKHPNAVRLLGHWHWPDAAPRFLVVIMEYVEGRLLGAWAREDNPSARRVVRAVLGVARALAAVHAARAVHRDVKEANIVLRGADGEAVLVDFGVGTYEGASGLGSGTLPPGTRAYLSPEAWRFHREHTGQKDAHFTSTPACDVWGLGVVLYWLLVDRRPFDVAERAGVDALLTRAPVAPHAVNPRVPPELGELCLRLLEKAPETRPDAQAVCAALEELLERKETAWDTPLCEFHGVHNATTLPGPDADDEVVWRNEGREDVPPRRGPRPPRRVEDSDASAGLPAPVAPSPPPAAPAEVKPPTLPPGAPAAMAPAPAGHMASGVGARFRARWGWSAVGLLLVLGVGLAVARLQGAGSLARPGLDRAQAAPGVATAPAASARESDWKVAPSGKPPEADAAVVQPAPGSIPAATASGAVTSEEAAPVKTSPSKQPRPSATGPAATIKAAGLVACIAASGCASTPVRPPPSFEPCPPRALETMKALGIDVGDALRVNLHMTAKDPSYITLQDGGWTSGRLVFDLGELPDNTVLTGRVVLSDPVQIRFVQAQPRGQKPVPVCIVARKLSVQQDQGPASVRVFSSVYADVVDRFE
ncbi:MAG TPA: protein kinase [Myxococcus sp.]|nr:protein kinase [Myxococcus sp.]